MNGFGETYKTATSGSTSNIDDAIATRIYFDQRGKPSWTSVPLTWAEAQDAAPLPTSKKVRFNYDPIGRVLETWQPNGAKSTTEYTVESIAGSQPGTVIHPAVHTMDPHCFDGVSETICGETLSAMDYRSNMIKQTKFDINLTDAGSGNPLRVTEYRYDLMDRLIGVTDPGNAEWTYTHDFKGNRTSSDDPGLGFWTMEYDANGNLTRQVDAKGHVVGNTQEIVFTYDGLNRVLTKTVNWDDAAGLPQSDLITYGYDQNNTSLPSGFNKGQLTRVIGDHNRIHYRYDEIGNLTHERHTLTGAHTGVYNFEREFEDNGALINQSLPTSSFGGTADMQNFEYDAAGRMTAFGTFVTSVDYNTRSQPTFSTFGNGMQETRTYSNYQGFLLTVRVKNSATSGTRELSRYWRTQAGRVNKHRSWRVEDQYEYCYDYAGRLTVAADLEAESKTCETIGAWEGTALRDQFFTYKNNGSMQSNSHQGNYTYAGSPVAHAPAAIGGQQFSYDANGNMTSGLNSKTMLYDGENRPLSISQNGALVSEYVYGADGTRLKKIDGTGTTLYVGGVEIRNPGVSETVLAYPHPHIRLKYSPDGAGGQNTDVSYMFRDQLNSVTMIADENQAIEERSTYKPFGEENEQVLAASQAVETIGWIGERFDAGAGLQYLNARYYDPELALFLQPDWFEVTKAGVGTNRYSYSFNDPINMRDPGGNQGIVEQAIDSIVDVGVDAIEELAEDPIDALSRLGKSSIEATLDLIPGRKQGKAAGRAVADGNYAQAAGHLALGTAEAGLETAIGVMTAGTTNLGIRSAKGAPTVASQSSSTARADYSSIANPNKVTPGGNFTAKQKQEAIALNTKRNDGTLRSDLSDTPLSPAQKSQRGVTPDPNEVQVDHSTPKSQGGTNASSNMSILSRQENRTKSDY
jgi:RHS repeat-associated protein